MSLYLDSSAWLKRYVLEPDSARCDAYLQADQDWITGGHTQVEVRRNLARLLSGPALSEARVDFARDWARTHVVEIDATTIELAASIAEATLCRSLDAIHLGAARRVAPDLPILTFDVRQALVARSLGMPVVGA